MEVELHEHAHRQSGDIVALRYITTDERIEMCWPYRVVEDSDTVLALFIAAGSTYKAGPKRTAAQKKTDARQRLPPEKYVWRNDTLRLMFPAASHSVSLFWSNDLAPRRLLKYFANLEEPFRRTACGFDTQDHTLDVVVTPELDWQWRDEQEFEHHVTEGFYTANLAAAARAEGLGVIKAIVEQTHACLRWSTWSPEPHWSVPVIPPTWDVTPVTFWNRRDWAYGNALNWQPPSTSA